MRKTLVLLVFSISVFESSGQKNEKTSASKNLYQLKSERQKTAGWLLLVGGSLLTIAGISIANSGSENINLGESSVGSVVAIIGAGSAIGGISLLSSSRKNAGKAAQISFNSQRYMMPANNAFAVRMQPTVALRIMLGNSR